DPIEFIDAIKTPGVEDPRESDDPYDPATTSVIYSKDKYFENIEASPGGGDDPNPCAFVPDYNGLPGAPMTALSSYYEYRTCVEMTGKVFVLELANGKHIKLLVESYYPPEMQPLCDNADPLLGTSPLPESYDGEVTFTLRWAFLD